MKNNFNSYSSYGERYNIAEIEPIDMLISMHALHAGSDSLLMIASSLEIISIHAPMRGATKTIPPASEYCHISIHAPMWGATYIPVGMYKTTRFQSTPPHAESDIIPAINTGYKINFNAHPHAGSDSVI